MHCEGWPKNRCYRAGHCRQGGAGQLSGRSACQGATITYSLERGSDTTWNCFILVKKKEREKEEGKEGGEHAIVYQTLH